MRPLGGHVGQQEALALPNSTHASGLATGSPNLQISQFEPLIFTTFLIPTVHANVQCTVGLSHYAPTTYSATSKSYCTSPPLVYMNAFLRKISQTKTVVWPAAEMAAPGSSVRCVRAFAKQMALEWKFSILPGGAGDHNRGSIRNLKLVADISRLPPHIDWEPGDYRELEVPRCPNLQPSPPIFNSWTLISSYRNE